MRFAQNTTSLTRLPESGSYSILLYLENSKKGMNYAALFLEHNKSNQSS